MRPEKHYNGEPPSTGQGVDLGTMELELVNRAIEAVRSEMEREKKKLSRIGDQEYEPTTSSVKRPKPSASSHQGYDPGSYQMGQASEYTPSPRSSKYTLDSENSSNNASALEYVPTAVSKKSIKKVLPPPPSRVKCKYTLDNSKPSTDMEYDPLSNYSAKPTVKEQRTLCSEGEGRKRFYPEKQGKDEEYVPTAKKPRSSPPKADVPKYTLSFSESDEESSGTEYRPTSLSRLQRKGINIGLKQERESGLMGLQKKQVSKIDDGFSHSESDDVESQDVDRTNKKIDKKISVSQLKNIKSNKPKKEEKDSDKKSSKERLESSSVNKTSKNSSKKDKNQSKTVDGSSKSKEKVRKDGTESKSNDEKNRKIVKIKSEHSQREKERGSGNIKKPKTDKPVKNDKVASKFKDQKNGKLESSAKEKDKKKSSHGSGSTNSSSTKDKSKKSSSIRDHKQARETKQRNLSHVDLFGAESAEEDDEEDERIVRKSASAFKRGSLMNNKRKTSEDMSSSSEDDSEVDNDDGGGDEAVDYSCLQDEMEYDSDPMEECLRIFNESKEVKTEDKGRQAKQVQQGGFFLYFSSSDNHFNHFNYSKMLLWGFEDVLLVLEFSGFSVLTDSFSFTFMCVCF